MLLFVLHVAKNTPVKLELVKPDSETAFESIDNILGNVSIKKLKVEKHLRTCCKGTFKIFHFFRCEALRLTYAGITKETS